MQARKVRIESQNRKGKYYYVDLENKTCSCPEFFFRMRHIGGVCKHIVAAEDSLKSDKPPSVIDKEYLKNRQKRAKELGQYEAEQERKERVYDELVLFVREKKEAYSTEVIDRFGADALDDMIRLGEITEKDGKIRLLE